MNNQVVFVDESLADLPNSHVDGIMNMFTGYVEGTPFTRMILRYKQEDNFSRNEMTDYYEMRKKENGSVFLKSL